MEYAWCESRFFLKHRALLDDFCYPEWMKFSFQLQFSPDDDAAVRARVGADFERIIQQTGRCFGQQGDPPTTVTIENAEPVVFWNTIKSPLKTLPVNLIVVCEGEHGWDDYLLLHHFNEQEVLDDLQ
jgi:hypothetical protein